MFINEYIADMTPSQLFVTYAGGMSTVGGTSLIIFMASGVGLIYAAIVLANQCQFLYHMTNVCFQNLFLYN